MRKFNIIISLLFSIIPFLSTQPLIKKLPQYAFINYEANKLRFPGNHTPIRLFYDKLDSLQLYGTRNISILHIGGSHVQADVFSNQMRMNLSSLNPGNASERGIIFPYRVAKTNGPTNYRISYTGKWNHAQNSRRPYDTDLGLTGYMATTDDSTASLSIKLNNDSSNFWLFNRIRLLGECSSDSIIPQIIAFEDTIIGLYDSVERCYYYMLPQYTDSIHIKFNGLKKDSVSFRLSGIIPENDLTGITYHSVGVNGASVPSWLRCSNFERELRFVKPDLVIFGIGINDANVPYGSFDTTKFKANYNALITQIKRVSPNCAFIFITNNDCYYRISRRNKVPNRNGLLIQKAFYELAKEHNAAVWDLFEIMGGLSSITKWQYAGLARADKIHFTVPGYQLLGDMLYNAIVTNYLYE